MTKRDSLRIELTKDQQDQIKAVYGKEVATLELNAERLEERLAPISIAYAKIE